MTNVLQPVGVQASKLLESLPQPHFCMFGMHLPKNICLAEGQKENVRSFFQFINFCCVKVLGLTQKEHYFVIWSVAIAIGL
jgi:hypothetical protein